MKLTVSIGTYNRPEFIQKQVRNVLKQLQEGVQLCVFDNCSDTPVATLFTQDELSQFTLIRNKINIGRDQNQVRSIEYVDDGWVWTLSDDDTIKENAIQMILDTIEKYPDYCYINFGNKKVKDCHSFEDLVSYFKIVGTFGNSFFQSECVYNVDRVKDAIFWFNDFLSSQIGQICMVMKKMELNEEEKCIFLTEHLLTEAQPGGWSPLKFIKNSSIIVDKYYYKKKMLRGSLFKGMCDMYFPMLTQNQLTLGEFLHYNRFIIHKFGFINIIRFNLLTFVGNIASMCFPRKFFLYAKKIIAKKYNGKVK